MTTNRTPATAAVSALPDHPHLFPCSETGFTISTDRLPERSEPAGGTADVEIDQ